MPSTRTAEIAIIGGGIIGLATTYALLRKYRDKSVILLEKEDRLAAHQSGHNSGVLHSGIYYKPGTLRAQNCLRGNRELVKFCQHYGIKHEICGKVIVATTEAELPRLQSIYERGQTNGVPCERIDQAQLAKLEPHAQGVGAIHVPAAGIVDYPAVCEKLGQLIQAAGARVILNARVEQIHSTASEVELRTTAGDFTSKWLITCGGLQSDRLARMDRHDPRAQIVPFRGEYFQLRPSANHLCRNLIYPVPDPRFPFLGVHFTRRIDGTVECGPNAVLSWGRENYSGKPDWGDLWETLCYTGFQKLAWKHWRMGWAEMRRSRNKALFLQALQTLIPQVALDDLQPAPAGIRAQAVSPRGELIDDFVIEESTRGVHVLNAPSPAATASLAIGQIVAERLSKKWW
ncbi:MAG: L-2-hydroxyglutarate oxidase [Pirellulales bacterium]|nr:L-2-hydroxyglutarate oxidase [Pirellulales bacterium]